MIAAIKSLLIVHKVKFLFLAPFFVQNQVYFCFLGKCPYDFAWADKANNDNSAHYSAECSNSGICDRSTVLFVQM